MKKYSIHLIALALFIILPSIYFSPVFEGKILNQSDMSGYEGMAKEIKDYRNETGEEPLWTNSAFGGMPSYLISLRQPNNILYGISKFINYPNGRPVSHIFLYMAGFYLLLLLFGVKAPLGIVGAIAYGFSSYFFIILEPGHITKAIALGYMPMVVGSVYYTFRKDILTGATLTAIFLGLQLVANHVQITYYTLLIILIFGIFELVKVIQEKEIARFTKAVGALVVAVVLAASINIVSIWSVMEYSDYSIRGKSDLTSNSEDRTSGLDKTYATNWSYGIDETLNLLIPNFKGGASNIILANRDSETFDLLSQGGGPQQAAQIINQNAYFFTQYWGTQPGTSGPVYIGAVVVFLFVFGLFFTRGRLKWWLFTVVIVSILLSWGKNFMFLTDLFLDHFPGYNKFRTVSMILVMAELAMPLLAILALSKLVSGEYSRPDFMKAWKYSLYIVGGIVLLFTLFPGVANLNSPKDSILSDQGAVDIVNALLEDRAELLRKDAFRSLVFVLLTAAGLWIYMQKKIKSLYLFAGIGLLILIDLWPVNKRYLNDDHFVRKSAAVTAITPTAADLQIMKDTTYYRVLDLSQGSPMTSARASYFHHSLGGYHGAKMRRYQELYDEHLSTNLNERILDMLNTKYIISRNQENGQISAIRRTSHMGNAWFVPQYTLAENADEEIIITGSITPSEEIVVDKRFENQFQGISLEDDPDANITLTNYAPNKLSYEYATKTDQIAVFSEIYYPKGWSVYINGEKADYFRANYVLRAMVIPAGSGDIKFEFKPKPYYTGKSITLVVSVILVLLTIIMIIRNTALKKYLPVRKS
jgi:hypothetical protein